jgi:hypothetical protein
LRPLEQEPVHGDGGDEQRRGHGRGHEREHVHATLERVDRREPVHERQREQEREQDLHPGLSDTQLLQQLGEVAVGPLQGGLRAVLGVPLVVAHRRRLYCSDPGHHRHHIPAPRCGEVPRDQDREHPRLASGPADRVFCAVVMWTQGPSALRDPLGGDTVEHAG